MSRFFVRPQDVKGDEILVSKEEAHHIVDVMRMSEGDKITAFDGTGKEYVGEIVAASKNNLKIKIEKINTVSPENKIRVTLAQAIPKRAKMDFIVEKATELGVDEIIPLITDRTIVRLDEKTKKIRHAHWQNVAITAAKQCGRLEIPKVKLPVAFSDFADEMKNYDLALMACLHNETKAVGHILSGVRAKKILAMIGPEGDFSHREIKSAGSQGAHLVTFGRLVLRVDTAAIFILSVLNYENNSV